jgi:hypothetical protein
MNRSPLGRGFAVLRDELLFWEMVWFMAPFWLARALNGEADMMSDNANARRQYWVKSFFIIAYWLMRGYLV